MRSTGCEGGPRFDANGSPSLAGRQVMVDVDRRGGLSFSTEGAD
jgi:hypothetical protein